MLGRWTSTEVLPVKAWDPEISIIGKQKQKSKQKKKTLPFFYTISNFTNGHFFFLLVQNTAVVLLVFGVHWGISQEYTQLSNTELRFHKELVPYTVHLRLSWRFCTGINCCWTGFNSPVWWAAFRQRKSHKPRLKRRFGTQVTVPCTVYKQNTQHGKHLLYNKK